MFNLKKYFTDELLQVALILSLLRIDRRSLEYDVPVIGIGTNNLTSSWDQSNILVRREGNVHPKSIDSVLLNYEQEVFHELNSLGRYNTIFDSLISRNLTAYLLNVDEQRTTVETNEEAASSVSTTTNSEPPSDLDPHRKHNSKKAIDDDQLSPEDLDVIETLWKYDAEVENAELSEDVLETGSTSGTVSPPDEPYAPDGSPSITPENSSPSDEPVPRNSSNASSRRKIQSDETNKNANDGEFTKKLFHDDLLDSDPWLGASSSSAWFSDRAERREEDRDLEEEASYNGDYEDSLLPPELFGTEFSLEETLQLIDLNEVDHCQVDFWQSLSSIKTETDTAEFEEKKEKEEEEIKEDPGIEADFFDEEELDLFSDMIHAPAPQYHSRPLQSRVISPYVRTMGMDHRWQDFASMMNFPDSNHASAYHHHHHHYHHHHPSATTNYSSVGSSYPSHHLQLTSPTESNSRNALLHSNSTLSTSLTDLNSTSATASYSALNNSCSIGTTVANSMNLTNNTVTETVITTDNTGPAFKAEPNHQESIYPYQNSCAAEMNHSTEGFLSSILNDEDLQLMDMAVNEGMYTMRMLDNGCSTVQNCMERGTDSDSAVSSMGSERVPSLSSDTEWMETNSDSGHTPADHYSSDYCNKYRWYDSYMYAARGHSAGENSPNSTSSRLSQIPQKKYQLYGRRCFQDQNTNNHIMHNHTYHLPPESINGASGTVQKSIYKDKLKSKSSRRSEDEQLTRDEKKARNLGIPIPVYDIINLPMDEFNERLSKYDLSETQLSLIRDIRRRGKNKVAAQNCRKRKLDQIMSLADEVKQMKDRKTKLHSERDFLISEKQRVQSRYSQLYRHIFQSLRDPDGNPFSHGHFSLQQAADGSVILVPKNNSSDFPLEHDISSAHHSRSRSKDQRKP
ncbi:endoplasmic reticulum membrane sensor NFE2L1 [Planococcus citri]|uniref:endoplasmic reticulum membrane sensor NFE2L1 n=1 Tax=Planococcus citri TaxID=170843 RepID=UPI0031F9F963